MVQTSLKHQEKPSEYLIYSPLLHIITNRPPCRYLVQVVHVSIEVLELELGWRGSGYKLCKLW